jgi:spore maturation protein SpmA
MVTNMIGIGNAATPAGLQVMENLENEASEEENIIVKTEKEKPLRNLSKMRKKSILNKISKTDRFENLDKTNSRSKAKELTDEMLMFLVINTASLQIIPTNVIAIRSSLESKSPGSIVVGVWLSSIVAFTSIVLLAKLYIFIRKNNRYVFK